MDNRGLLTGLAAAALVSAAVGAAGLAHRYMASTGHYALWEAAGFALVLFPAFGLLGRRYDRLKQRADRDSLTGLWNRGFAHRCIVGLLKQAEARRKRLAVMLIDLNDFKLINDGLGHAEGDRAISMAAGALEESAVRGEIVCRWGGDEFLLLCPYADRQEAECLKRAIDERMEGLSLHSGLRLSASCGYAFYPEDGTTLAELSAAADRRLYDSKHLAKLQSEPHRLEA
ncbi:GGDEF domain-containing protein [Cohnella hashimotonis]|uniref:GGDEF domain-containing protein n=1 Tax=Cohnella hashimotonis TaxID=2826895 RepID=A0ABT6TML7_9BACL|nr:GGDEF domain-containing protein [Cohnella hashimotonis]MDI4647560.1 GGDEF domain-containing protein [Cohnella hashimotonis]